MIDAVACGKGGVVERVDVAIIGTGFAGLGMAAALRRSGREDFVLLEKADRLGGVWRDNTYPGAACDVTSSLYSYSFHPGVWSRTYGVQTEILAYLEEFARSEELEGRIRFGHHVVKLTFDETRGDWKIKTADGRKLRARVVISAVGQLNVPSIPAIKGFKRFEGDAFHSATWNHEIDLSGKRVGVFGTGASAIQLVPRVAEQAAQTVVFQRSAPYIVPRHDQETSAARRRLQRWLPITQRPHRLKSFLLGEVAARAVTGDKRLARQLASRSRSYLEHAISDPMLRSKCTPDYQIGCKRILISSEWYPTLLRDDVKLETSGVAKFVESGVVLNDGTTHELDVVIWATGFASTDFLSGISVRGREGKLLADQWVEGASAYRGTSIAGFPNLFLLYGPNTNLGTNSIVYMLERQCEYVVRLLDEARNVGATTLEVRPAAQERWQSWVEEKSAKTAFVSGCSNWYLEDGRNTNNWPATTWRYGQLLRREDLLSYDLRPASREPIK